MLPQLLDLWKSAAILSNDIDNVAWASNQIMSNWIRYKAVGDKFGIPAWVIGVLHYRESNFDFTTHLANGQPLNKVTTLVPKGLGPFKTWEEGAVAALVLEGWEHGKLWDLVNALNNIECFNGGGYRLLANPLIAGDNRPIPSPYLWSGTNHYLIGKYGSDGNYNPHLVDQQIGCGAIMLCLKSMGVDFHEAA